MDGAAQMRAECAGLHRTADNARRVHRLGTVTQKVLGASAHRATQENRSCAIPTQAYAECVGLPRSVAQTRIECMRSPKETACTRYRTSVEQRSALPLKGAALPANNKPPNERIAVVELARELNRHAASAAHEQTHLAEHPGQLVWIFMGMSVVGLAGETLQHLVAFGELESRAGFIWGPFSPIYGLAAVLLTMLLEPLQDKGVPLLLAVSAVVGGSLEYFASWAMETFWGVVAWSYLNIPLNFDGRTDVFHCLIWGTIGVLWVKVGLQLCQRIFNRVNTTGAPYRVATAALSVFMAFDIAMTIIVLLRADARTDGIPPQNPIEQFCDTAYPTDMLQKRFHNMGGIGI